MSISLNTENLQSFVSAQVPAYRESGYQSFHGTTVHDSFHGQSGSQYSTPHPIQPSQTYQVDATGCNGPT